MRRSPVRVGGDVLLGMALVLLVPSPARPCSCAPTPTVAEELQQADAVFTGEVTKLEVLPSWWDLADDAPPPELLEAGPGEKPMRTLRATFAVGKAWKGPSDPVIVIHSSVECCVCGRTFDIGRAYLVYAFREKDGRLATNACARGGPLDSKDEDLAQLGAPSTDFEAPRREKRTRRALGKE